MKSQLKTPKQVKVTAVVTMLKVFGDKINSKGLRVLLDKASSSDLLFIKKGSQKSKVHTQHEEGYARSCGTSGAPFKQKGGCN